MVSFNYRRMEKSGNPRCPLSRICIYGESCISPLSKGCELFKSVRGLDSGSKGFLGDGSRESDLGIAELLGERFSGENLSYDISTILNDFEQDTDQFNINPKEYSESFDRYQPNFYNPAASLYSKNSDNLFKIQRLFYSDLINFLDIKIDPKLNSKNPKNKYTELQYYDNSGDK